MASGRDILDSGGGSWWRADEPAGRTREDVAQAPDRQGRRGGSPDPGAGRPPGWRARLPDRRLVGLVVVAALVGGVLGAYADRRLDEVGADAAARAALDVRLDDEMLIGVGGSPAEASFVYQLELRNAGPRPVVVEDLGLLGDPLSTDPLDGPVTLPTGKKVPVQLSGTLDCGAVSDGRVPPVTASLTVRTTDGQRHVVALGAADSGPRRALIQSCSRRSVIEVVQSLSAQVVGGRVESRIDLRSASSGVKVLGLRIEPPGAFDVKVEGVPLTLGGDALGRLLVTVSVSDCARALAFDPSEYVLLLHVVGAPREVTPVRIPDDLGLALVRLSERFCRH